MITLPHIIKRGHKGAAVRWAQNRLNAHGIKVAVDGDFGAATGAAVVKFQRMHGLVGDGIIGPGTQAHLRQPRHKLPGKHKHAARFLPKPRPVTRRGSIGVRAVATMERWAGRREDPRGSNRVPSLVKLARRVGWTAGVAAMGFSWCNYGLHLALALNKCKTLKASGTWGGHTGMYVPATRTELERLVKIGKARRVGRADIHRGDIIIMFNEGHIGMARGSVRGDVVSTIECNTSSGAAGSQSNGDGCYKRQRNVWRDIDAAYRLDA